MVKWETVRKRYGKRIKAKAFALADELRKQGFKVEDPFEMDCDSYSWQMLVTHDEWFPEVEQGVDVSIEIVDSHDYEGFDGGYTFCLDIVEYGGRILGGCAPYNYTEKCWVKTLPEIWERWEELRNAIDADAVAAVITEGKGVEL